MQDKGLEVVALLTAGANDPASIGRATDKSKPGKADMAFILKDLNQLQTLIIMAKYASCESSRDKLVEVWGREVLEIARVRKFSKRLGLLPITVATIKEGIAGRKFTPAERTEAMGKPKTDNKGNARLTRYQEVMDLFIETEQSAIELLMRNLRGR
jgi:hypothetical protein